ncbi:MAG: hypothetical protein H6583_07295 [Alteromonas sp.]|nr:hypothetical protein [Alteromonas sp.]
MGRKSTGGAGPRGVEAWALRFFGQDTNAHEELKQAVATLTPTEPKGHFIPTGRDYARQSLAQKHQRKNNAIFFRGTLGKAFLLG